VPREPGRDDDVLVVGMDVDDEVLVRAVLEETRLERYLGPPPSGR
jgi:hypothetical protein